MNVKLGTPYEAIVIKVVEKGYAASHTEVIRQALIEYERKLDEEEVQLVNRGIELEMQEIRQGKTKTISLAALKKRHGV